MAWHEPPDDRRCTAHSKRGARGRCKQWAMQNRNTCYFHGGPSPRGLAHPATRTGRISQSLPVRLQARFEAAARDPDLLDQTADLAVLDSRIADVLARVDTGEAGALWRTARQQFDLLQIAISDQDAGAMRVAIVELQRAIGRGVADYTAWAEVINLIEARRKLVESQQRLLTAKNQIITVNDAVTLATAMLAAVRAVVTDRQQLYQLQVEFDRLMNINPR